MVALACLLWAPPFEDLPTFVLWIFGLPWLAGAVALVLWPRSSPRLAWVVPFMVLALGLVVAMLLLALSNAGG